VTMHNGAVGYPTKASIEITSETRGDVKCRGRGKESSIVDEDCIR